MSEAFHIGTEECSILSDVLVTKLFAKFLTFLNCGRIYFKC